MENTMKMYVTADEAAQILGVSRGYAYKIIRGLNNESCIIHGTTASFAETRIVTVF